MYIDSHTYGYLCYICIGFNAILSNPPTLSFLHYVHKSVVYVCVLFCPASWIIRTIFLDAIYIHIYIYALIYHICLLFLTDFTLYNRF